MQCIAYIVDECLWDILCTEQYREDCIPPSGQSCRRTQMVAEHCKNNVYAVCAKNPIF